MPQDDLNEREFELINIIGAKLATNQRDVSRHMNYSLGMTNMLIRRLIAKGYIRLRQLNKRKVEYILTSKGFSEKMRKSIKYTLKTIRSIGLIKDRLRAVILPLYKEGERVFYILGHSDLAMLIEVVFKEAKIVDYRIQYISDIGEKGPEGVLLICQEGQLASPDGKEVNLIEELAKITELADPALMEPSQEV